MQSFLPSGYSFSPDKLINNALYKAIMNPEAYMNTDPQSFNLSLILLPCFLLLLCVFFVINVALFDHIGESKRGHHRDISWFALVPTLLLGLAGMTVIYNYLLSDAKSRLHDQYNSAAFYYPIKSNLTMRMLSDQPKPKNIHDRNAYPYRLYANKKLYLGKMENKQFVPAENNAAIVFYKYNTYITKHHLNDKFSKHVIFKRDAHYLATDSRTQWILTNNKDIVLHINDDLVVKQSNVIKNQKD